MCSKKLNNCPADTVAFKRLDLWTRSAQTGQRRVNLWGARSAFTTVTLTSASSCRNSSLGTSVMSSRKVDSMRSETKASPELIKTTTQSSLPAMATPTFKHKEKDSVSNTCSLSTGQFWHKHYGGLMSKRYRLDLPWWPWLLGSSWIQTVNHGIHSSQPVHPCGTNTTCIKI